MAKRSPSLPTIISDILDEEDEAQNLFQESPIDVEQEVEQLLDLNSLKQEIFLKILVLGDMGSGKTSLIRKYTESDEPQLSFNAGTKSNDYKVSIDTGYSLKKVEVEGKIINIQLWDVPGHERFGGLTRIHYKYAHGALIVFDLSRLETFDTALNWLSDVTEKLFDEKQKLLVEDETSLDDANKAMPIILLANKCDLPDLKISRQKYSSYVKENGLLGWYETSARDYSNVSLAVRRLVEYILSSDPSVKIAKENARIWRS